MSRIIYMGKKKKKKIDQQKGASTIPIENVETSGEKTYDGSNQSIKCPSCNYIIPFHNEVEINKKGAKCSCVPCVLKVNRGNKTINIDRRDNGDIHTEIDSHFINFSFNKTEGEPITQEKTDTNEVIKKILDKS